MSKLVCSDGGSFSASYDAFSGLAGHVNDPGAQGLADVGPLPVGNYFIVDRPEGHVLGPVIDYFTGHAKWFALFRDDGSVDDETFVGGVKRGKFRLHPKGPLGISEGCITINKIDDFNALRAKLLSTSTQLIPGTSLKAYGKVEVK